MVEPQAILNVMENNTILTEAVREAGGQSHVANACSVSQPAVAKWLKFGLPRTEWTGETNHHATIIRLARKNGFRCTKRELLSRDSEIEEP